MKTIKVILALFFVLFFSKADAQSLTQSYIDSIQFKIYDIFQIHEKQEYDTVESEIILVILQTDNNSNIIDVRLLVDERNKGIAYEMLNKLTPDYFKGWSPKNFSNRTIMVPVYCGGLKQKTKNSYVDKAFWPMAWAGGSGKIEKEDKRQSVLLTGVMYLPSPPTNETGILPTRKQN